MPLQIAPSLLSADFLELGRDVAMLNKNADIIHLDIMDGTFVPNISFGFSVVEAVGKAAKIPCDAHFMVTNPEKWVERSAAAGVSMMSFHLEAAGRKTRAILRDIRAHQLPRDVLAAVQQRFQLILHPSFLIFMLRTAETTRSFPP